MESERATRRTLVRVVLLLTADTPLAPGPAERNLLALFLRGVITLDQLLGLAEERLKTAQAMHQLRQLMTGATYLKA